MSETGNTEALASAAPTATLTGVAYVVEYLQNHPEFFDQQRELLTQLVVPHHAGAVSLVERQVQALRDKNRELQAQLLDMLRNARENEQLLTDVMHMAAKLVHAENMQQLAELLRHELHQHFHTDAEALLLCVGADSDAAGMPPLRYVPHTELLAAVGCGFPDAAPVCGLLDDETRRFVFGDFKSDLRSVALLPLGQLAKHGVLAIASRDRNRFSAEIGTLFLELLAQYVNEMVLKLRGE